MALGRYEHTGNAAPVGLALGIGASDAAFTLTSGTNYPTGAIGDFVLCLDAGTPTEEKILCSLRSGVAVTVAAGGRGYDGTTPSSHNSGTVNVIHVLAAAEIDDASAHINTTTRDDHLNYLRTDGTRAGTGNQTLLSAAVTNNLTVGGTLMVTGAITGSSTVQGTAHTSTLSGTGRYVGTTSGAPSYGSPAAGDFANDPTNQTFWLYNGSSWVQSGGQTDAAWTAVLGGVGFTNGWANQGGLNAPAGYRLVNGRVYLRGALHSGSGGLSAFTLPSGYRPAYTLNFTTFTSLGTNTSCSVYVTSGGGVTPGSTGNPLCDLAGISFDTLA